MTERLEWMGRKKFEGQIRDGARQHPAQTKSEPRMEAIHRANPRGVKARVLNDDQISAADVDVSGPCRRAARDH